MRQASLFDHCAPLDSAMPAIKAAMRAVAGAPEGEGAFLAEPMIRANLETALSGMKMLSAFRVLD